MAKGNLPPNLTAPDTERRVLVGLLHGAVEGDSWGQYHFPSLPAEFVTAVLSLVRSGKTGLLSLVEELGPERINAMGGLPRLAKFVGDTIPIVTPSDLESLRNLHERRTVFAGTQDLLRGAVDTETPVDRLRARAQRIACELPERRNGRKTSWSLAELMTAELPPPTWIVPGILPAGLTILSGRPKSGKSFLALQLALAVVSGGSFLDKQMAEGSCLYIALEDSEGRLQRRLRVWGAAPHLPMQVELAWPSLAGDGLGMLLEAIDQLRPHLVVVDTLSRAFATNARRLDWNDAGDVTSVLAPLQTAAIERDVAVICVDHQRKPAGMAASPIDDLIGSSAKSGVLDTAWGLYRERMTGKGTLAITGRDVEEGELALQWDGETTCWQLRGDARQIAADDAAADVFKAIRILGGSADASSVAKEVGKSRIAARNALERLTNDGRLHRAIVGDRGTVVYSLIGGQKK